MSAHTGAVRVGVPGTRPRTPQRSTPVRPQLRLIQSAPATSRPRPVGRPRAGARPTSRQAPFVFLLVALLVGTTLGLLVLNTAIAVDSLEANRLRADNAQRAQEIQRLEQQVVTGAAPAELAGAAKAAGLVPAGPAAYLVIGPDGSVSVRGTAAPAGGAADPQGD